jgi:hypothetical protein
VYDPEQKKTKEMSSIEVSVSRSDVISRTLKDHDAVHARTFVRYTGFGSIFITSLKVGLQKEMPLN